MGMRGVVSLAPPAAEPEGVEEQEEEVQAQTEQRHSTEEQDRLQGDNGQHEMWVVAFFCFWHFHEHQLTSTMQLVKSLCRQVKKREKKWVVQFCWKHNLISPIHL